MIIMSSMKDDSEKLLNGIRLSTLVPGKATGEGKVMELKGADLVMKLHYIRALYFFPNNNNNNNNNQSSSFVSLSDFKSRGAFDWLVTYFMTCGRVREGAPPVMKFNDAGIRFVEAHSTKTLEQWLDMPNFASLNHLLTYNHVIGPDIPFTPLVFLQVTWFKCGGVSVGLSWAHILGDAFAASEFLKMLGLYLQGGLKPKVFTAPNPMELTNPPSSPSQDAPLSIKRVDPIGDCWVAPTNTKMGTHSFCLTQQQLDHLHSNVHGRKRTTCFEVVSGVIWKCIAKIRNELNPKAVTIIRPKSIEREHVFPYNGQSIGTVVARRNVSTTEVSDLVSLIEKNVVDETETLAKWAENSSSSNAVVYGGNLTFVDMEEANIYGFKLKGQSPILASYDVGGIGDEGMVIVLPGPSHGNMVVMIVLPLNELELLKLELEEAWSIA